MRKKDPALALVLTDEQRCPGGAPVTQPALVIPSGEGHAGAHAEAQLVLFPEAPLHRGEGVADSLLAAGVQPGQSRLEVHGLGDAVAENRRRLRAAHLLAIDLVLVALAVELELPAPLTLGAGVLGIQRMGAVGA